MKQQKGFTLIELIVVIVILGILAATAMPKFINMSSDAETAALKGVAGALSSANAVNYGGRSLNTAYGVTINSCDDIAGALEGGLDVTKYTLPTTAIAAGSSVTCSVTQVSTSNTADYTATGIN